MLSFSKNENGVRCGTADFDKLSRGERWAFRRAGGREDASDCGGGWAHAKWKMDLDSEFFGLFQNGIFIFGGFELGLGKCSGMQMGGGEGVAGSF